MDIAGKRISNGLIVTVVGAIILAIVAISLFSQFNTIQKQMIAKENALSAQYQDNQNELSTFTTSIKETMGVAERNTQALDTVLQNAVKGRYEGNGGTPQNGQLLSAMVEAYPNLDNLSTPYAKIQDAILAGRTAYKNKQSKLLDMLRDYDTWRNSGIIRSQMTKMMGAPSNNLVARVGSNSWSGADGLAKMYQIVLADDAVDSYNSGRMTPMDLGPTKDAAPTTALSKK